MSLSSTAPLAPRQRGFTLTELMICVSIAGILSTIALPGFQNQLQKARRADALIAAMTVQLAQERFRSNGAAYGSLAEIGVPAVSAASHYGLEITSADADGFELVATANGAQARDENCRYMRLRSSGMNLSYASGPDATVANPAAVNNRCWSL